MFPFTQTNANGNARNEKLIHQEDLERVSDLFRLSKSVTSEEVGTKHNEELES